MNRTGEGAHCPCFGDEVHGRSEPNRCKETTLSDEGKERKVRGENPKGTSMPSGERSEWKMVRWSNSARGRAERRNEKEAFRPFGIYKKCQSMTVLGESDPGVMGALACSFRFVLLHDCESGLIEKPRRRWL